MRQNPAHSSPQRNPISSPPPTAPAAIRRARRPRTVVLVLPGATLLSTLRPARPPWSCPNHSPPRRRWRAFTQARVSRVETPGFPSTSAPFESARRKSRSGHVSTGPERVAPPPRPPERPLPSALPSPPARAFPASLRLRIPRPLPVPAEPEIAPVSFARDDLLPPPLLLPESSLLATFSAPSRPRFWGEFEPASAQLVVFTRFLEPN
ncbi:hypothetical protein NL676_019886 [Syzygium grande]|nr:hypothetical protein NL676_019886 [Syzygium grande]